MARNQHNRPDDWPCAARDRPLRGQHYARCALLPGPAFTYHAAAESAGRPTTTCCAFLWSSPRQCCLHHAQSQCVLPSRLCAPLPATAAPPSVDYAFLCSDLHALRLADRSSASTHVKDGVILIQTLCTSQSGQLTCLVQHRRGVLPLSTGDTWEAQLLQHSTFFFSTWAVPGR